MTTGTAHNATIKTTTTKDRTNKDNEPAAPAATKEK